MTGAGSGLTGAGGHATGAPDSATAAVAASGVRPCDLLCRRADGRGSIADLHGLVCNLASSHSARTEPGGRARHRRAGQAAHERRRIRLRRDLGDQRLDLALGAVDRAREQRLVILLAKVRRQRGDGAHVETPVGQHREHDREPAREAGDRDPEVRLGLRKMEPRHGVDMHRWTGLEEVEPASVHLGEVPDELGLDSPSTPEDLGQTREQGVIG